MVKVEGQGQDWQGEDHCVQPAGCQQSKNPKKILKFFHSRQLWSTKSTGLRRFGLRRASALGGSALGDIIVVYEYCIICSIDTVLFIIKRLALSKIIINILACLSVSELGKP